MLTCLGIRTHEPCHTSYDFRPGAVSITNYELMKHKN